MFKRYFYTFLVMILQCETVYRIILFCEIWRREQSITSIKLRNTIINQMYIWTMTNVRACVRACMFASTFVRGCIRWCVSKFRDNNRNSTSAIQQSLFLPPSLQIQLWACLTDYCRATFHAIRRLTMWPKLLKAWVIISGLYLGVYISIYKNNCKRIYLICKISLNIQIFLFM